MVYRPSRKLSVELLNHGFINKPTEPRGKYYYVNGQGFQVVLSSKGMPAEVRLLNPAGYTLYHDREVPEELLNEWSQLTR